MENCDGSYACGQGECAHYGTAHYSTTRTRQTGFTFETGGTGEYGNRVHATVRADAFLVWVANGDDTYQPCVSVEASPNDFVRIERTEAGTWKVTTYRGGSLDTHTV